MKTGPFHGPNSNGRGRAIARLAGVWASGLLLAQGQTVISPGYAYPPGSGDAAKPGVAGKLHVARASQSFNASIGRANAQLRNELIDNSLTPPAPYLSLVQTQDYPALDNPNPVNADGTFVVRTPAITTRWTPVNTPGISAKKSPPPPRPRSRRGRNTSTPTTPITITS
jgi:hypothetical protein